MKYVNEIIEYMKNKPCKKIIDRPGHRWEWNEVGMVLESYGFTSDRGYTLSINGDIIRADNVNTATDVWDNIKAGMASMLKDMEDKQRELNIIKSLEQFVKKSEEDSPNDPQFVYVLHTRYPGYTDEETEVFYDLEKAQEREEARTKTNTSVISWITGEVVE